MSGETWLAAALREAGLLLEAREAGPATVGATQDSRRVERGCLFVALPGERADGHEFADAALAAGARGALLADAERFAAIAAARPSANLYHVAEALPALQALAAVHLVRLAPTVVAVTGSSGKTGTKEACRALLATLGPCFASAGNYNNLVGLPLTVLGLREEQRVAVLEMGCSGFGEIERLCELFPPEIGIVTGIGHAHLEELGDLAGVARAKGELPAALPPGGLLLLPGDAPHAADLIARSAAPAQPFGFAADAALRVEDLGPAGLGGRRGRIDGHEFTLPQPYRHALLAVAAAWGAATRLGAEPAALAAAAAGLRGFGDRGGLFRVGGWTVLDDSYNANPDSLRAALAWLGEAPAAGRRWAAVGDMLELGDAGLALHAECGRAAAAAGIDGLYGTGALSRHLVEAAREAGLDESRHFADTAELAAALAARLAPGDLLLLKGSRGMAMENVLAALEKATESAREEYR